MWIKQWAVGCDLPCLHHEWASMEPKILPALRCVVLLWAGKWFCCMGFISITVLSSCQYNWHGCGYSVGLSAPAMCGSLIRDKCSLPLRSSSSVQLGKGGDMHRRSDSEQCLKGVLEQEPCCSLSLLTMSDEGSFSVRLPGSPHPWVSWHALPATSGASSADSALLLCAISDNTN